MVFKIISENTTPNGLDIVKWIGEEGIDWQLTAIDDENAGRTQDLEMHRGLRGYKAKCTVSCLWMNKPDSVRLLRAIMPEYITVITDTIPWESGTVTLEAYSNNQKAKCLTEYTDGTKLYGDVQFPIVEA